jgi:hypothetical protein
MLISLENYQQNFPKIFMKFPSNGDSILLKKSYKGADVLWGKHTGLLRVAQWKVDVYNSLGVVPNDSIDPIYVKNHYPIKYAIPITAEEIHQNILTMLKKNRNFCDLGNFVPNLSGQNGIAIIRYVQDERYCISCYANDKYYVFVYQ